MKGFGTDEKALIRILSDKDPLQIEVIRSAFHRNFKRNLLEDLRSETSGNFEKGLVQLARGPLNSDINNLYDAMDGPGTKEVILNDILLGRSNADMKAIKSAYQKTFGKSLESMLKGDLSMKTERHFMIVIAANRAEDSVPVDPRQTEDDVTAIYKAGEGRMGTDEVLICQILSSRNNDQIRAIAHAYKQKFRKDLEDVIKSVSAYFALGWISATALTCSYRNSLDTCAMRFSSNCGRVSISTCTRRSSWRSPWLGWGPRIICW